MEKEINKKNISKLTQIDKRTLLDYDVKTGKNQKVFTSESFVEKGTYKV